jgi:hypothetical protein
MKDYKLLLPLMQGKLDDAYLFSMDGKGTIKLTWNLAIRRIMQLNKTYFDHNVNLTNLKCINKMGSL